MHSTAISLTLPALTNTQRQQLLEDATVCSLYELFATIPDPHRKEGRRYELPYLLTCLVVALLCNCNSTLAVATAVVDGFSGLIKSCEIFCSIKCNLVECLYFLKGG